ncbi:flagellar basal body L-ring protein FlgH [Shewanella sp. OPT22]|nr:flagellar basal body L-ring protein FlgH [Shewanella sp. OPT22]
MMRSLFIVGMVVVLSACNSTSHKPIPDDPFYAPVYPDTPPTRVEPTGSIYMDAEAASLYSDIRAHKVGDIITINLSEATQARKSATSEITKANSNSIDPIFGGGANITLKGKPLDFRYNDSFDTSRESDANQSNSLSGSISANVMKVLSNGHLVVRGEKWISINNGEEFIRVTGLVRSEDIRPDNTIDSTRIANARIQYSGTGTFAEAQKVGWLNKFFLSDWWPF